MSEPHQAAHPYLGPIYWSMAGLANVFAWVASFEVGTIVTFCSVAVPAVVGAAALAIDKLTPSVARFRKAWRDAGNESLSGKIDVLAEELADARKLAETKRRIIENGDRVNAELMAQLRAMAGRLEDANRKLHDLNGKAQDIVFHGNLAEQQQDAILAKLDRTLEQAQANAGLTGKVDDKASHIVEAVDTIAGRSGDDLPAAPAGPGA